MLESSLAVNFNSKQELKSACLPFIKNGLLVQCDHANYQLGQAVALQLKLWNISQALAVPAKIVWIAPQGAGLNYAGVGVQFDDEAAKLVQETLDLEPLYVS